MNEPTERAGDGDTVVDATPEIRWTSAAATDVGKSRKLNEDSFFTNPEIGLWAVADGVGGASAGDRASSLIVQALGEIAKPDDAKAFLAEVARHLANVNETLIEEGQVAPRGQIASTIVALLFFRQHFSCLWAGDSRLYLLRGQELRQISRDHSRVQELVDQGLLTPEEARQDPRSNVITRAVGAEAQLELDMVHERFYAGDLFLLCSDGLTKTVADHEIAAILRSPAETAVAALIGAALDRGAPDNVTVVVVETHI
jgi:serine/threonine protein phosphatase PrpC